MITDRAEYARLSTPPSRRGGHQRTEERLPRKGGICCCVAAIGRSSGVFCFERRLRSCDWEKQRSVLSWKTFVARSSACFAESVAASGRSSGRFWSCEVGGEAASILRLLRKVETVSGEDRYRGRTKGSNEEASIVGALVLL